MNLDILLKQLRLSTVQPVITDLIPIAEQEGWTYTHFLERILAEAVAQRTEKRITSQIAQAKFPFTATIETFDFTFRRVLNDNEDDG